MAPVRLFYYSGTPGLLGRKLRMRVRPHTFEDQYDFLVRFFVAEYRGPRSPQLISKLQCSFPVHNAIRSTPSRNHYW